MQYGVPIEVIKARNVDTSLLRYLSPLPLDVVKKQDCFENECVILDVETTGVEDHDEVTSLSYVKCQFDNDVNKLRPFEAKTLYNEPTIPISEEITKLTGIDADTVRGHKITKHDLNEIFTSKVQFVAAHNAQFDRKFMEKLGLEDLIWGCSIRDIDIRGNYEAATSSLGSVMAQAFGYYMNHHDSLEDSFACYELIKDNFQEFVGNIYENTYTVYANNSRFDQKDKLKKENFRWDGSSKVWVKIGVRENELDFIQQLVIECGGTPMVVEQSVYTRYKK